MVICELYYLQTYQYIMFVCIYEYNMTDIVSVIKYLFYSNFIFIDGDLTILNNVSRALSLNGYAVAYAEVLSSSINSVVFIPPECFFSYKKHY